MTLRSQRVEPTQDDVKNALLREVEASLKYSLAHKPQLARKHRKQRPRLLHFIWKRVRLTLCQGGNVIAAWPRGIDPENGILALIQTKVLVGDKHYTDLSWNQQRVRSMALRLREALVKAEHGPRRKSAQRQRIRLDRVFKLGVYRPIPTKRTKANVSSKAYDRLFTWTCACDRTYNRTALRCDDCGTARP
jgi:hypothetical protein